MITILLEAGEFTAAAVDEDRGVVWLLQQDGSLWSVDLAGSSSRNPQQLRPDPSGIVVSGSRLVVAHGGGTIDVLDADDPGAPPATPFDGKDALGQVALTRTIDPSAVVVTAPPGLRRPIWPRPPFGAPVTGLTVVDLTSGGAKFRAIPGLSGVAVAGASVYVGQNTGFFPRGQLAVLRGLTPQVLAGNLPPVGHVGLAEGGDVALLAHPASKLLTAVRPGSGEVRTVSTAALSGAVVEAHGLTGGRIVVLTTDVLAIVDDLAELSQDPRIDPLAPPIFVGSWTEVHVDLGTSGLSLDDVHLEVPEGPTAGIVSYTRVNGLGDPVPLLVVGGVLGKHPLRLVQNSTSTVLDETEFEITDLWTDDDHGPPGAYMTDTVFADAGWGGGPGTPQNVGTHTHIGTWRTLVLMVDTSSGRWPTDAPTRNANQTAILNHATNGISFNGVTRSTRQYYEENSVFVAASGGNPARGLTIGVKNNQTFGPVNLSGSWTDYFQQTVADDGTITDARWSSKGGTLQSIITKAIDDGNATTADFTDIDAVIVVPFSPDTTTAGDRFVWPHSHDALEYLCGTDTVNDRRSFGFSYVPLDFDVHDGRQMHTTLSHELGHTLSLPDLYSFPEYSDEVDGRLTGGWDMMAGSRDTLPHYTISNKMRMSWIDPAHLKLYNFQGSSAALENVTLHAAELGDPPAGRFKAIEIRLGDGWNYYVEYRHTQPGEISDSLPTDRRVIITDVVSETYTPPIARPQILFVPLDLDGDGPILDTGMDLDETDPGTQMDLQVKVVSTADDNAVVQVSYGSNGKPEPGIRPWTGAPNWQSPDIEVRNDKAAADPAHYFNVPWEGHDNTVVAKVRNNGDLLATGVVVDFFVTEYSNGDGPWVPLGNATNDVPPGATVEFTAPWNPPSGTDLHFCVIVRIRLYQDPANLAIVDQNIYNNEARSNYTQFVSATSSPASRVGARVLLSNPFQDSTLVFADVKKSHPLHRVYATHQWLRISGTGQSPITVYDESLDGTAEYDRAAGQKGKSYLWEVPNRVSVKGWARRPFEADCGGTTLTGGVGIRVDAGRATRIQLRAIKRNYVSGLVEYVDTGTPITSGGTVLLEITLAPGKYVTVPVQVDGQGGFSRDYGDPWPQDQEQVVLHYLGAYGAAASDLGPIGV